MYIVTVSRLGDKHEWRVEGICELFRLLDSLLEGFFGSEITVELE